MDYRDGETECQSVGVHVRDATMVYSTGHRRFIYKADSSTHAEGTDPRDGLSERARVRRHYAPLRSTLVAANSSSIIYRWL